MNRFVSDLKKICPLRQDFIDNRITLSLSALFLLLRCHTLILNHRDKARYFREKRHHLAPFLVTSTSSVPKKADSIFRLCLCWKLFIFKFFHFPGNSIVIFGHIFWPFLKLEYGLIRSKMTKKVGSYCKTILYLQFPVFFT